MSQKVPMIRPATQRDGSILDTIRKAAFAPIFASFRSILGDEIYEVVQSRADEQQADLLLGLLTDDSDWQLYVAELEDSVVGFVSFRMSEEEKVGEIGLNAVHPDHAGAGIGTMMYDFALTRMKEAGMLAATVSTGGDASHAPARHAYEKVGFCVSIPSVWMCRLL